MRHDGRLPDQLRPIKVTYNVFDYAAGSVLFEQGKTRVLCAVTINDGVPPFLKGRKTGWLTAEYAMLPAATPVRNQREAVTGKRSGRSVEISRLIGRVVRCAVKLDLLADKTIVIDCDVQQADGGTRAACITASMLALRCAQELWLANKIIQQPFIRYDLAAVSVGVVQGRALLDIDFQEDSTSDADYNLVLTSTGSVVEIQGSAEKDALTWEHCEQVLALARSGVIQIFKELIPYTSGTALQQSMTGYPVSGHQPTVL